jgi:hypothetical protein
LFVIPLTDYLILPLAVLGSLVNALDNQDSSSFDEIKAAEVLHIN